MTQAGIPPMQVKGADGINRSFDEHYDTMMDVEQDPTGAFMAIQSQAERIKTLESAAMDRLVAEGQRCDAIVKARNDALREAADKLYQRFYPQNEESDWTEFAVIHADVAKEARNVVLALISEDSQ